MLSKHSSITVICLFVILLCRPCLALDSEPIGWAIYNDLGLNGVTGGAGGETVIVTTGEDLKDYIRNADPYIILVQGTVTMAQTEVKPNKTIIGIGTNPTVVGGFRIKRSNNVIIRNLIIRDSSYDGFSVEYDTHHVWIDHCDISNCTDGLLDITHACDYVTVSWNHFSNHHKTCLLGHADDNGDEDIGHLKVTYHHNWFDGTSSRHPRVRFSYLTHVFNNYYYGNSYGIASTCDAEVLVEGCYFQSVSSPTLVGYGTSWDGDLVSRDNIYVSCGSYETSGTVPEASDYYSYTLDSTADVPAIVTAGAGLFPEEYDQPPVPDTMTWFAAPYATSTRGEIKMTASTAYDYSGVEYYFTNVTDPNHDSGWQISSTYTDTGLDNNTPYTYWVKARDMSVSQIETNPSALASATTIDTSSDLTAPTPDPMTWAQAPHSIGGGHIAMTATTAFDINGVEYYFANLTDPNHDSGWQTDPTYVDSDLDLSTLYTYQVIARDFSVNQNETDWSDTASVTTAWTCTAPIDEDLSGDCQVNMDDFAILVAEWMSGPTVVELVTNGGFTTNLSDWTLIPSTPTTITWDSGTALLARNDATHASDGSYLYQVFPVISGKQYKLEAQWKGDLLNGGTGRNWAEVLVGFGPSPTSLSTDIVYKKATDGGPNEDPMPWDWESVLLSPNDTSSPADGIFTAIDSYMIIAFSIGGDAGVGPGYFYVDNVSVVEVLPCPEIDLIDDCQVNLQDLEVLVVNWLTCNRYPSSQCWQ